MKYLQENDEEALNRQFKRYVDSGINGDNLESVYTKAHAAIRANPTIARAESEFGYFGKRTAPKSKDHKKVVRQGKMSNAQKKNRVMQKLQARNKSMGL